MEQFKKDLAWFRNKLIATQEAQHANSLKLSRNKEGIFDIAYSRVHWVYLNIDHLTRLVNLHQEIVYRHHYSLILLRAGELTPEKLRDAVCAKLRQEWVTEELPSAYRFNPSPTTNNQPVRRHHWD